MVTKRGHQGKYYGRNQEWRMAPGQNWSKTWTFYEGDWHEGNIPIMGVRDHAAWLCSSVFDGARTFEGVSPDLDLHCARVNASAETMHLKPTVSEETWMGLTRDGIKRFDKEAALYIRPMYWAERSGTLLVAPDPESTKWCLSVYEAPMRKPEGFSITLSPYRKPSLECMPVNAKAGCLYPNNARALVEARFSSDAINAQTLAFYRTIQGAPARRVTASDLR